MPWPSVWTRWAKATDKREVGIIKLRNDDSSARSLKAFSPTDTARTILWPGLIILLLLIATSVQEHRQGRSWWCSSCGSAFLWTSNAWGSQTSQVFLDPYSFTHILHGLAFCGLLALLIRGMSTSWRLGLALALESTWEIIENSNMVIERYRAATAALGYQGDTVLNSLGDIFCCAVGFMIGRRLGWRRSILVFIATELILLIWIRDSLLLEILMLIHPINAIKAWQISH